MSDIWRARNFLNEDCKKRGSPLEQASTVKMEDFAHILQRDYGLKPAGRMNSLDKNKSGSGGGNNSAGRNNQTAAHAAVIATAAAAAAAGGGEDAAEAYFRGRNGTTLKSAALGSSPDDFYRVSHAK